jgi:outer membrane scaffolding protein for murein synthesis (MipA/OmpV family)
MKHWIAILLLFVSTAIPADELSQFTEDYRDTEALRFKATGPRKFHGLIGGAHVNYDKIIGEQERGNAVLPLVILSYAGTAYWAIAGGGVWLASTDDRSLRLGVAMRLRRGWKTDGEDELSGLQDRERTVDVGFSSVWRTRAVTVGASVYSDVSGNSDGRSATARVSVPWHISSRWSITPTVGLEWWSDELVDHYYGVSSAEATPFRAEYAGRSATNVRVGLGTGYWFESGWQLLGGLGYTRFGDGITASPIVSRDDTRVAYVGAWWLF